MTGSETALESKREARLAVSLRALFFLTFVAACMARWLDRYGIGLSVALAWCAAAGAMVGAFLCAISFIAACLRRLWAPKAICGYSTDFIACSMAGTVAGLASGAIGFLAFIVPKRGATIEVSLNGLGISAIVDPARGPVFIKDVSSELLCTMIIGALAGSIVNSIACMFRSRRSSPWRYLISVSGTTAIAFGPLPVVLLVAFIFNLPEKPGMEYEWFGLWPIAAVFYFAIFAFIGAVCGAIVSAVWILARHAQTSRTSWIVFWFSIVWVILLATEAGLLPPVPQSSVP
jgi:MFS family permease